MEKPTREIDIWGFSADVSNRLLLWNAANITAGLFLSTRDKFWQGFGSQNVGWGIINIGIALGGLIFTQRRKATLSDPYHPEIIAKETRNLRRLLWINAGLDILYMIGGRWLAHTRGKHNKRMRGIGIGIVLQGGLLFVFDVVHALLLEDSAS